MVRMEENRLIIEIEGDPATDLAYIQKALNQVLYLAAESSAFGDEAFASDIQTVLRLQNELNLSQAQLTKALTSIE